MELIDVNGVSLEVRRIPAPGKAAPPDSSSRARPGIHVRPGKVQAREAWIPGQARDDKERAPGDDRERASTEDGGTAPVVFLHEGLGSVDMWQGSAGYWPEQVCEATGRAGVVYSRRGYGRSSPVADVRGDGRLPADYLHREAFDVLPALLSAQGIVRPVLVGHSDGGSIALLHASRHPVAACVVMAPHVMVEDISIAAIAQARDAWEATKLRERLARYHADVDGAFWQWNDVWLSPAFRSFDIRPDCRQITAPVLALQGVDDPYGTMAQIEQIRPTQGTVWLEKLAQCGHSPHRDQPALTLELITRFLQTQS